MTEADAFRLLDLSPGATQAAVRASFRRKVMERHPDTALEETAGSDVQALVDAYRLLIGAETRTEVGTAGRFDEGADSGRRIDVDRPFEPDTPRSAGSTRPCQGCGGAGFRRQDSTCPGCRGAGQVTIVEVLRVRVSRCRTCQGRGRVRAIEVCEVCRVGSDLAAHSDTVHGA